MDRALSVVVVVYVGISVVGVSGRPVSVRSPIFAGRLPVSYVTRVPI